MHRASSGWSTSRSKPSNTNFPTSPLLDTTTHNTPVPYSIDNAKHTPLTTKSTAIVMFTHSPCLYIPVYRRPPFPCGERPRSRSGILQSCSSCGLGLISKPASRWLAATESRVAVEGEVEVDVEVLLFGVSVEGVDGLVVEVLLSGVRGIMGSIAVTGSECSESERGKCKNSPGAL